MIKLFQRWRNQRKIGSPRAPRIIDYVSTGWGHNWQRMEGGLDLGRMRIAGWCSPPPMIGDLLRFRMASGRIALYRVEEVEPCADPPDMYFATIAPSRYEGEESQP
jgi:hypothetical protein